MFNFNFIEWFFSQDILGPIISFLLTIVLIQFILPFFRRKKDKAKEKLEGFYEVAYAFIKIRENFSIPMGNEIHNKENCGYFHNFNFNFGTEKRTGLVFDELLFFDYVSSNFRFIDKDLKMLFINYFKMRGPGNIQNKLGCKDNKLISLRKEIENKINRYYSKYTKEFNN